MDKEMDLKLLAALYESKLDSIEKDTIKALLNATWSVFPKADIFVVKNSENRNPVLRFGSMGDKQNRVALSVNSPENHGKKRPIVYWGGQGTTGSKVKNSKIHKLKGIKKVFGTKGTNGIALADIDSDAIERFVEFLKRHSDYFSTKCFDGCSSCYLSFGDLHDSLHADAKVEADAAQAAKFASRRLSGEEIVAWLEEKSELQEPLTNYLKNVLSSYEVSKEKKTKVGSMDLFLSPKDQTETSPVAVLELKAIKSDPCENGANRTKVRHSYGQLLDYSVNLYTSTPFDSVERWLIMKCIPNDCLSLLEKLTQLDSNFSVWTYNENDEVPLVLKMGETKSFAFLSSGTNQ